MDDLDTTTRAHAAYRGASGSQYHDEKRHIPDAAVASVARARAKLFQHLVSNQGAVFEYGVGAGWNLAELVCAERVGFDISAELQSRVEKAGIRFCTRLDTLSPDYFDLAICHHVLEHLPNPLQCLVELTRLIKPTGYCWVAVPFETGRRYRRFDPMEPNHHLFSWNPQTLGNLVRIAGWERFEIRLRRYGYDRAAASLAVRLRMGESGFRLIRAVAQMVFPLTEIQLIACKPGSAGILPAHW